MSVKDKINYLLQEKNMLKRDFTHTLLRLEPKLNATGKAPSQPTIYVYLNGKRLSLYYIIAEVLNTNEQELFESNIRVCNAIQL